MQRQVDTTALKVNQAFIVGLGLLAFVLGVTGGGTWIVLFVGLVLGVGTLVPSAALFKRIYTGLLRPMGVLNPNVISDDPQSHQFAQGIGAVCMLIGAVALFSGATVFGWSVVWLVIALATINLVFNFCAGCFMYYQLGRSGLLPRR